MVAIPLALLVQGDHKQVGASELSQELARTLPTHDRVAKRTRHPPQDRGHQQKLPHFLGEARQNLLSQQVDDVAVAAPERCDKGVPIFPLLQREGGEVDRRRPTLGTLEQHREIIGPDVQPHLSFNRRAASSSEKASCSVRISFISPLARHRPSGSGGSVRLERTRWTFSGRCSTKKATDSWQSSSVTNW